MLVELVIANYAVVERLRVGFHRGLNLLTGETGSGKSIVVDALGLLFGSRASADAVRTGAERARVSGLFEAPSAARALLESAGVAVEDGELLLEREVLAGGKSRAFAGDRPVTAALLRELAPFLGDIHGQHDQQALFAPAAQRDILDSFAACAALREQTAQLYREWRDCAGELQQLEHSEQEKLRLLDLWTFQHREIEAAAPEPAEDARLDAERRVLQNVVRLQESAAAAFDALYESPSSASAGIRQAIRRLEEIARIDTSVAGMVEALRPAEIAVEETSRSLRDYLSRLEADPGRLEEVETRLAALDRLKRKYGASLDDVLAFAAGVRARIEALETAGERQAALRRERQRLAAAYEQTAAALTAARAEAARRLERNVESELASLMMQRTVFRVRIEPAEWAENGADHVRFMVSANVGEEPRPLEEAASGGEISRIALALKTCVAAAAGEVPPTLVFDEVDAGIGGAAAEAVGRKLKRIASSCQVLCVTHLAQIAGFADHHYAVEKAEQNGRTVARIQQLDEAARVREIARMLSGQRLTPEAIRHAEQLLRQARGPA